MRSSLRLFRDFCGLVRFVFLGCRKAIPKFVYLKLQFLFAIFLLIAIAPLPRAESAPSLDLRAQYP
jgi:hypothetical protein